MPAGDAKRLLLDRDNYYAMTGGHGACRGCGEVTAIRLVVAANRALHEPRRREHVRELENLIDNLQGKLTTIGDDKVRAERIRRTIDTLEKRLYLFESRPERQRPGQCRHRQRDRLQQRFRLDLPVQPVQRSVGEQPVPGFRAGGEGHLRRAECLGRGRLPALRTARLELDDAYDPVAHDAFFKFFRWSQFTKEELGLLPTVISMGGDGATYDIGFGALSRLLVTDTPIKVMVLNSGVYSNTGGQASTASYSSQDSDLTRFGKAQSGKQEDRKELGLIAAFHPNVFVVQTSTALQGHFMKNMLAFLNYSDSPAVLDVYTPCQAEHGIADAAASEHGRLAVESRMSPVFVHDPRRGDSLSEWFSLEGNPEPDKDWASTTIEYVDADGSPEAAEHTDDPGRLRAERVAVQEAFPQAGGRR